MKTINHHKCNYAIFSAPIYEKGQCHFNYCRRCKVPFNDWPLWKRIYYFFVGKLKKFIK